MMGLLTGTLFPAEPRRPAVVRLVSFSELPPGPGAFAGRCAARHGRSARAHQPGGRRIGRHIAGDRARGAPHGSDYEPVLDPGDHGNPAVTEREDAVFDSPAGSAHHDRRARGLDRFCQACSRSKSTSCPWYSASSLVQISITAWTRSVSSRIRVFGSVPWLRISWRFQPAPTPRILPARRRARRRWRFLSRCGWGPAAVPDIPRSRP